MTKKKTRKAVQARFKVTATGKLLMNHAGRRHILTKKASKRKRHLKKQSVVDKAHTKTYSLLIGA
ncbi:MAG: 50S ribosomal protein L35 [Chlamydiae bacterium]|nr:50S ribosomal protein L35 [Chlamydiota bacterium]